MCCLGGLVLTTHKEQNQNHKNYVTGIRELIFMEKIFMLGAICLRDKISHFKIKVIGCNQTRKIEK